jgi:hypothetical protein
MDEEREDGPGLEYMRRAVGNSVASPLPGLHTKYTHDEPDDLFVVQKQQDVEPILKNNHALRTLNDGFTPSRDMKRIASIPMIVINHWREKLGIDIYDPNDLKKVKQLLNDPDWQYLKTSDGRV